MGEMRRYKWRHRKRRTGNWIDLKVVKHGKTLDRMRRPANSWVDNYYQWMAGIIRPSYSHYFWLVPTSDHPSCTTKHKCICGPDSSWDDGDFLTLNIEIGDSSSSWRMDQCCLQGNRIAGKIKDLWLDYRSSWTNIKMKSEITVDEDFWVREAGLVMKFVRDVYGNVFHALLDRSVIGAGMYVPSGSKVIVTYTIRY